MAQQTSLSVNAAFSTVQQVTDADWKDLKEFVSHTVAQAAFSVFVTCTRDPGQWARPKSVRKRHISIRG